MATEFEKEITASNLARWVGSMNGRIQDYNKANSPLESGIGFLNSIGWALLPGLIECKSKAERLTYLKKELPDFLSINDNKKAICEIGILM